MELAVRLPAFRSVPAGRVGIAVPKPDLSDGELIRLIADGDRDAFEQLYQRYARSVYGLALRRLRDRERAEDAVQETFASIWRSASSYRAEQGSGAPWLYAVARNAIVDRFRSMPAESGDVPETATGEPGPEERAETAWTSWQVHSAFGELPDSEQRVIELAYWGGLSQSEIADFLGIPLGTVKTRTRSGLNHLAELLEGELS
jgi:RNA polymerase sigma-70 factor (ECF subfamily)